MKKAAMFGLLLPVMMSTALGDQSSGVRGPAGPWAPTTTVSEVLSAPIVLTGADPVETPVFASSGKSLVGLRIHVSDFTGDSCYVSGTLEWRWTENDSFFRHTLKDSRLPEFVPGTTISFPIAEVYLLKDQPAFETPLLTFPQGPQGRVLLQKYGDCTATVSSVLLLLQ